MEKKTYIRPQVISIDLDQEALICTSYGEIPVKPGWEDSCDAPSSRRSDWRDYER